MIAGLALGVAQGIRHSLEPDHLAAVSALLGELRSVRRSAWLGALWGIGHTVSLVMVAVAVLAFGATVPGDYERAFELAVGVLLIVLGVRAMRPARHAVAIRPVRTPAQAVLVGAVHGLAGSSALTGLVVAALPTTASQLGYISLFGVGSVVGMAVVSAIAGAGLARIQRPGVLLVLRVVTGTLSIGLGVYTFATA